MFERAPAGEASELSERLGRAMCIDKQAAEKRRDRARYEEIDPTMHEHHWLPRKDKDRLLHPTHGSQLESSRQQPVVEFCCRKPCHLFFRSVEDAYVLRPRHQDFRSKRCD